jgi:hypothetical protein
MTIVIVESSGHRCRRVTQYVPGFQVLACASRDRHVEPIGFQTRPQCRQIGLGNIKFAEARFRVEEIELDDFVDARFKRRNGYSSAAH